jgi:dihydrofolate reductase
LNRWASLPGRTSIIITRQIDYRAKDCLIANSLAQALEHCSPDGEIFIAGGGEILKKLYRLLTGCISPSWTMILTVTLFFLNILPVNGIFTQSMHEADDRNKYPMTFLTLDRHAL